MNNEQITELRNKGTLNIYGFGTFILLKSRERSYNGFKKEFTKPQYPIRVKFKPSQTFIKKVNNV